LGINPGNSEALYNLFAYYYQKEDWENSFYWAKQIQSKGFPISLEMSNIISGQEGFKNKK